MTATHTASGMAMNDRQTEIDAQASQWLVRLAGAPLSAREQTKLATWLDACAEHRKAFELAEKAWQAMGHVTLPVSVSRTRRGLMPAALAATVLVAFAGLALYRSVPWFAWGADYYTPVGSVRALTLPDGSVATLDSHSAISVFYEEHTRRIRLLEGSARFDVAQVTNPTSRPFIVQVGGGTVRALGTRFVISVRSGVAEVRVLEHSVLVTPEDRKAHAQVVREGESSSLTADGAVTRPTATTGSAPEWVRGNLVFSDTSLRIAVAEINRYRKVPLLVWDRDLGTQKISGVFRIDEIDTAADLIARELNTRVIEIPWVGTVLY